MPSYKVLIAEDNQILAESIAKILNDLNIDNSIVMQGDQILKEYNSDYYDMVLLDIMMPKMDGYMASRAIRDQNSLIPIVAFTCLPFDEVENEMAKNGINHYISKPNELNDLKALLHSYFDVAA
ncbi:MAG: response regulator [Bacteroidia bacterium]|nr:response regulator [Bacteroidia bacterium]NNJ55365.1 response regulator [Bacteroidia bacterium]